MPSLPWARNSSNPPGTATPPRSGPRAARTSAARRWASVRPVTPAAVSQARSTRRRRAGGTSVERSQVDLVAGGEQPGGDGVERVGVLAELLGGTGEGLGHAAREHVLQERQDLVPQPDAGEARIDVVRVVPHRQPEAHARGPRRRAADPEKRAQPRCVPAAHARERARAGPAAEAEQHGFGLVVEGVAEQDRAVGLRAGGAQRGLAGVPRGGLDPAGAGDVDGVDARRDPPLREQRDGGCCAFGRPVLKPVVDDHGQHAVHPADRRGGEGEGKRVGAAGAADDQRRPPGGLGHGVQRGPHRPPHLRDRRPRAPPRRRSCPVVTGTRSHARPAAVSKSPTHRAEMRDSPLGGG